MSDDDALSLKYCLAASLLKLHHVNSIGKDDGAGNKTSYEQQMDLFLMQTMHQSSNNPQINEMKQSEFFHLVELALIPRKESQQVDENAGQQTSDDKFSTDIELRYFE